MSQLTPFAMVHSLDQWRRGAYKHTALEQTEQTQGIVKLAWLLDERVDNEEDDDELLQRAGLAFDPWCRLYRSIPESGHIERILWAAENSAQLEPLNLFSTKSEAVGDFSSQDSGIKGALQTPIDIVADLQGRLYIAEAGSQRLLIFDLIEKRLLDKIQFADTPIKLITDGKKVWVLFATTQIGIAVLNGRHHSVFTPIPESIDHPTSLAVNQGQLYLINHGGTADAQIVPLANPEDAFRVAFAKDIVFLDNNILVVARKQSEDFLRFQVESGDQSEISHLKARHYDGRGIVVTPDGHVGYCSKNSFMRATLARVRYQTQGTVTSFRLDGGEFQRQWGRLFIDACIPRGTSISARCLCLDEIPETTLPLARTMPVNVISLTINRPDLSPPMPPEVLLDNVSDKQIFHRRFNGRELPWQKLADEQKFQTYEAPIIAPLGRYLWVQLELQGTARLTPRIKSLRAQYPGHDLLNRLPQVYSRDLAVADFLQRYLAMLEGELNDLDIRASYRHQLLDPAATPAELLPWLGGFMGMVVDLRWSEQARRELVTNAIWLFRFRGTVAGLKRLIEIYLEVNLYKDTKNRKKKPGNIVTIIEHFKLRGLGGALLGESDALASNSILGAGFHIGGKLGEQSNESINEVSIEDAITTHAHRFSLILAESLTVQQQEVIAYLMENHRPAHTLYDICTIDAGLRVGLGIHAGLNTLIGHTSGFGQLQLGASVLGVGDTVGVAKVGATVGSSRLGNDTRVG